MGLGLNEGLGISFVQPVSCANAVRLVQVGKADGEEDEARNHVDHYATKKPGICNWYLAYRSINGGRYDIYGKPKKEGAPGNLDGTWTNEPQLDARIRTE